MNVYCKVEAQEDYKYVFQYAPDRAIQYPCFFNIDTTYLDNTDRKVGILVKSWNPMEKDTKWVTVEEMKSQIFIHQLTM